MRENMSYKHIMCLFINVGYPMSAGHVGQLQDYPTQFVHAVDRRNKRNQFNRI